LISIVFYNTILKMVLLPKRKLTVDEIDKIYEVIPLNTNIDPDIAAATRDNVISGIKRQLEQIEVYPEVIPKLFEQIRLNYEQSFVHPGEGVGCIAASSIGEVATQASLNSFHSSGLSKANLTTGVTRIKELLNASKVVKTPSCTIYLKSEVGDLTNLFIVKDFCDKELIYYDINSILKDISIEYSPELTPYENMYYNFFKTFYKEFDVTSWRICITFSNELLYKIKKTLSYIAGCIKLALSMSEESITIVFYPDTMGRIDIWVKEDIETPLQIIKKKKAKQGEEIPDDLPLLLNDNNKMYFFIKEVIIRLLLECPVSGMFGIEECYYTEDKNGEWFIDTKGSNFREIINHPLIDSRRCKSNNVWDVYEIFGIDAAKNFLEEEFGKNIAVNKRHLDLLTASMTTNGKISSVSRYGIDRKQVGPLAKICFEQPFDNVIQAALNGEKDRLVGASANITLGKHIKSGTGMVKLIMDTNHLKKLVSDPWTPTLMKKSLGVRNRTVQNEEEEEQTMY
jgi:DNA-directed RNA polymerase II subunit RPB1